MLYKWHKIIILINNYIWFENSCALTQKFHFTDVLCYNIGKKQKQKQKQNKKTFSYIFDFVEL